MCYDDGMAKVKAHFDGKVFVPDEPVDFRPGARVDVTIAPPVSAEGSDAGDLLAPVIVDLDRDTSLAIAHDPELRSENL